MRPIWTVVYLDHTAKWSGGEIALLRMLEALDRGQVRPIVLLAEDGPFRLRLEEANVETHILPLSEKVREVRKDSLGPAALIGHAGTAIELYKYSGEVANFAKEHRADALHCNSLKADFYGALAGKRAKVPVIWHVRDNIDPTYLPGIVVKLFRWFARTVPAYVITNSESTTEKLFPDGNVGKMRYRVVHDGLADRELTTPRPETGAGFRFNPPRIGMVGRIVAWKGQHIFLRAAKELTDAGVEARFVIVGAPLFGEQEYETELHKQAESLGERVEFLGFQSNVPDILKNLDILIHASTTPEPFGQVVIEGMAEGLPVIASDGGGVREIVTDGVNGVLTPMGDSSALALEIRHLLQDPWRTNGIARAGWDRVRSTFTAGLSARGIEAVYEDLLGKTRPHGAANIPISTNATPAAVQPPQSDHTVRAMLPQQRSA